MLDQATWHCARPCPEPAPTVTRKGCTWESASCHRGCSTCPPGVGFAGPGACGVAPARFRCRLALARVRKAGLTRCSNAMVHAKSRRSATHTETRPHSPSFGHHLANFFLCAGWLAGCLVRWKTLARRASRTVRHWDEVNSGVCWGRRKRLDMARAEPNGFRFSSRRGGVGNQ